MQLTYSSYLKISELTNLQSLKSNPPEHDEMLFIIIHQAYELWFKQILHECDEFCIRLNNNRIIDAQKSMKRINTILKVLVHQRFLKRTKAVGAFENLLKLCLRQYC